MQDVPGHHGAGASAVEGVGGEDCAEEGEGLVGDFHVVTERVWRARSWMVLGGRILMEVGVWMGGGGFFGGAGGFARRRGRRGREERGERGRGEGRAYRGWDRDRNRDSHLCMLDAGFVKQRLKGQPGGVKAVGEGFEEEDRR